MDIIIHFINGPLDGYSMASDSNDQVECEKVRMIAHVVGDCLKDTEKREVQFNPGLKYTVPSPWVMDVAKSENWSKERIAAIVPNYEYKFSHFKEAEGIAEINMLFSRQW
jgi:hypothetical protein